MHYIQILEKPLKYASLLYWVCTCALKCMWKVVSVFCFVFVFVISSFDCMCAHLILFCLLECLLKSMFLNCLYVWAFVCLKAIHLNSQVSLAVFHWPCTNERLIHIHNAFQSLWAQSSFDIQRNLCFRDAIIAYIKPHEQHNINKLFSYW